MLIYRNNSTMGDNDGKKKLLATELVAFGRISDLAADIALLVNMVYNKMVRDADGDGNASDVFKKTITRLMSSKSLYELSDNDSEMGALYSRFRREAETCITDYASLKKLDELLGKHGIDPSKIDDSKEGGE